MGFPYQFAIGEQAAREIMEVYDYNGQMGQNPKGKLDLRGLMQYAKEKV